VAGTQPGPATYPVLRASAIPKTQIEERQPALMAPPEPPPAHRPPTQTVLSFDSDSPRVIPFHVKGAKRTGTTRRRGTPDVPPTRRARVAEAVNLELGLREALPKEPEDTAPRSFLYGYARAASPMHRSLAAVLDGSMILIAAGLFLLTFHLGGGELAFNKGTVPFYAAVPLLIAWFYEMVCALGGGVTVGMHWTRLRLLNFDGRKPSTEECLLRVLGNAVSLAAIGLGHLWALFDEENLAWQDHISKTFPTPSQIQRPF
jgi:uncharacterized RDD family membrane protein YckC